MLYCMESGSGKSVIFKWMEDTIERLRDKIAKLKYYEHMEKYHKNRNNKENEHQNIQSSPLVEQGSSLEDMSADFSVTTEEVRQCMAEWDSLSEDRSRDAVQERRDETTKSKTPKFIPPQLIYEKITLAALVEHLGCNLEGRYSAIQLVDEAASIYKTAFDPGFMGKGMSDYFLDKSFLIKLFDGSRITNETKDAIRNQVATTVKRHGLTAFMGIQPANWFQSLLFRDDEGIQARAFTILGERVKFDASNEYLNKDDERVKRYMSRLTQNAAVTEAQDEKVSTYQLMSDISEETPVQFDMADVLYTIYKQHSTDEKKQYEVCGDANFIGHCIVDAEKRLDQHQHNPTLAAHERRWLGKSAAKVLRLVWPLHALIYIYANCSTKEDLRDVQIPQRIDSEIVGFLAADIYADATRTYMIPFEYLATKKKAERSPMWKAVARKILLHPDQEITWRTAQTNWTYKSKGFHKSEIQEAFDNIVNAELAVYTIERDTIRKIVDIRNPEELRSDQVMVLRDLDIAVKID